MYTCENCYNDYSSPVICCGKPVTSTEVDLVSALEEQGVTTFFTTVKELGDEYDKAD